MREIRYFSKFGKGLIRINSILITRKIRSVMDSYVVFCIERCEFESQQGRFFEIFFSFINNFKYLYFPSL